MSESEIPVKPPKKFRKGDLIKVNRELYENSLESDASDQVLPEYLFEGPGELLMIEGDYCQVRWRRPVPDVWLRIDQLESWKN
tara:strand:- start:976 stop:1224 length:249 start_codon:yes stop_codon:yes gene_type:complete